MRKLARILVWASIMFVVACFCAFNIFVLYVRWCYEV